MAFAQYEMRIIVATMLQSGRMLGLAGPLPAIGPKGIVLGPAVPIEACIGDAPARRAAAA
jgi:hypothetical protein